MSEIRILAEENKLLREEMAELKLVMAFPQSEKEAKLAKLIRNIEATLTVPAAEYVPAIRDVFRLIDKSRLIQ